MASFDEFPMLRPDVDPQLHVSRNSVDQPFNLMCEKDTVIAQFTGNSRVEFHDGPVRYFETNPGDFVYVPAQTRHRLLTVTSGVVLRYKAVQPGKESVIITCSACGTDVFRHDFNATEQPAQKGYDDACQAYNADEAKRTCAACGTLNAPVDLTPFRWSAIADKLSADEDE